MSTFTLGLRYFFIDLIGGIIRWPFWWYTKGFVHVTRSGMNFIKMYARMLSIRVWIKNIFVPMFGMYDWQSRLISFFMRVAQIIIRSIGLFFLTIAVFFLIAAYLISLPVAIVGAVYHLTGGLFL